MKKVLFLLFCVLNLPISAQYFVLSEKGLISKENSDAKFIIIEKPGLTQAELFNQIKNWATQFYVSPKDVISESGNEMITLNGVSDKDVWCKKGFGSVSFTTNYTIVFQFKDGKIRVNIPTINSMKGESRTLGGDLSGFYQLTYTKEDIVDGRREQIIIFNKKKIKNEAKESIENLFNAIVKDAVEYKLSQKEEW